MKTNKLMISLSAIVLVIGIAVGFYASKFSPQNNLRRQLELGNKYLVELDYENAKIAFEKILKIDPKNIQAILGLANAYIGLGEEEKALEIMLEGYQQTQNKVLEVLINQYQDSNQATNVDESNVEGIETEVNEDITPVIPVLMSDDEARASMQKMMKELENFFYSQIWNGLWNARFLDVGNTMDVELNDLNISRAASLCVFDGNYDYGDFWEDEYLEDPVDINKMNDASVRLFGKTPDIQALNGYGGDGAGQAIDVIIKNNQPTVICSTRGDGASFVILESYFDISENRYMATQNIYEGYWGHEDSNLSNFSVTVTFQGNEESIYGMKISSIVIERIDDESNW